MKRVSFNDSASRFAELLFSSLARRNERLVLLAGVLVDEGFDDGEDLLLLVAGELSDGFELSFQSGLGSALAGLRLTDPQSFFDDTPNASVNPEIMPESM